MMPQLEPAIQDDLGVHRELMISPEATLELNVVSRALERTLEVVGVSYPGTA